VPIRNEAIFEKAGVGEKKKQRSEGCRYEVLGQSSGLSKNTSGFVAQGTIAVKKEKRGRSPPKGAEIPAQTIESKKTED